MKKIILSALSALAFCAAAFAAEAWTSDYAAAVASAKKADKPVLVLFTGSDWCPPCMYMERNVFPSKEFAAFAEKNLVLVKVEFLRNSPQPDAVRAANSALAEKFGIEGFPTTVILSPDGKEIARRVGGAPLKEFMAWLEQAVKPAPKAAAPAA